MSALTVDDVAALLAELRGRAARRRPPQARSRRCTASSAMRGATAGSRSIRSTSSSATSDPVRRAAASGCSAAWRSRGCWRACSARDRLIVATALYTGLRISELLGLIWERHRPRLRRGPCARAALACPPWSARPGGSAEDARLGARHPARRPARRGCSPRTSSRRRSRRDRLGLHHHRAALHTDIETSLAAGWTRRRTRRTKRRTAGHRCGFTTCATRSPAISSWTSGSTSPRSAASLATRASRSRSTSIRTFSTTLGIVGRSAHSWPPVHLQRYSPPPQATQRARRSSDRTFARTPHGSANCVVPGAPAFNSGNSLPVSLKIGFLSSTNPHDGRLYRRWIPFYGIWSPIRQPSTECFERIWMRGCQ